MRKIESLQSWLNTIERTIAAIAIGSAWLLLPLLIVNRTFDIVARQFIMTKPNLVQLVEWRAFLFLVMLSFGFAYLRNTHIRVDIIRVRLSRKAKAWCEIVGFVLAIIPVSLILVGYGVDYAHLSYWQGEREGIFLGRPLQWIIKGMLPFGFFILFLAGCVGMVRNVLFLRGYTEQPFPEKD